MYQNLLTRSSLYPILLRLEEETAAAAKALGCPCGGTLHRAYYRRKPRGAPPEVEGNAAYRRRLSFCCAVDGCRRRTTPPSVLFLGRKVYFGAVVTLVSVLRHGASPVRLSRLRKLVGASARTVRRWRQWWLANFVESAFWRGSRGRLRLPLDESRLPLSLLETLEAQEEERKLVLLAAFGAQEEDLGLVLLLRFVSPLTMSSAT